MTVMVATLNTVNDDNQYPDLGTMNHITNDLNNLNFGMSTMVRTSYM